MNRFAHAWRGLEREQRLAAAAAIGLFFSMFLPWYSKTVVEHGAATQTSSNAFQDFSFVEVAVLLVSAGVLAMLFARAERRNFLLPGGDGLIVMIAGGWTAILIFYRLVDKPGVHGSQRITATVGVEWGIFIALLVALGLLYTGARMRRAQPHIGLLGARRPDQQSAEQGGLAKDADRGEAHRSDSAAADEEDTTSVLPAEAGRQASTAAGRRPRYPPAPARQMSFEDRPPGQE